MSDINLQLAFKYFENVMGMPLDQIQPVPIDGWKLVEILWPLNDLFRPYLSRIRTIKYNRKFEEEADKAIELYVRNQNPRDWNNLAGETWRVLLERHQQLLVVALANEHAGNPSITQIPFGLPHSALLPGIMLLLLHSMELPWPPEDRTDIEFPNNGPPTSLAQH
jgi:hypothetical protein